MAGPPPGMAYDARPAVLGGLIGAGIQASRTPAMHEREGALQGLRYVYRRIDLRALQLGIEALPELLRAAERMGFAGLNITHPAKQAVVPLLDELSDAARALGAVNTVVFEAGRRIGHNTDGQGFAESFRHNLDEVPRDRVVLLGAGGAGTAVAYAALILDVGRLTIVDLEPGRAARLAARLCGRFGAGRAEAEPDPAAALAAADGLINATPVGMAGYPGPPLLAAPLRPGSGSSTSSTSRSRPSSCGARGHLAAGPRAAATWRSFRRPWPSGCSPGSCRTPCACAATLPPWQRRRSTAAS